jgi:flagellar hook assembly protein FlgD
VANVTVHDVRGRLVRQLLLETVAAGGTREVFWDGRDRRGQAVSPGTYLVRLRVGQQDRTRKIQLTR